MGKKVNCYIPWTMSAMVSQITTCWTLILMKRVTLYKGGRGRPQGKGGRGEEGRQGREGKEDGRE